MKRENLETAKKINESIETAERLIKHIDSIENGNSSERVQIALLSNNLSKKYIEEAIPELVPVILIVLRNKILKDIQSLSTELETL